jgi:hypothetical protein
MDSGGEPFPVDIRTAWKAATGQAHYIKLEMLLDGMKKNILPP